MRCFQKTTESLAKITRSSPIPDKNIGANYKNDSKKIVYNSQNSSNNYYKLPKSSLNQNSRCALCKVVFQCHKIWRCSEEKQPISLKWGFFPILKTTCIVQCTEIARCLVIRDIYSTTIFYKTWGNETLYTLYKPIAHWCQKVYTGK